MSTPRKARTAAEALSLEQIPNVGRSIANDLRGLGIATPLALRGQDPLALYARINRETGVRHDPCLLDVFMAAVAFMDGGAPLPWWSFTPRRKKLLGPATVHAPPR